MRMQAMIFAAGLGTRLRPLTDTMPKALVRVGDKTLLEHVILELKAAGADRIVINVHHFAGQIIDFIAANNNFGLDILISDETGKLLETGGGIKKAMPLFHPEKPILVHNVDILSNVNLKLFYDSNFDNDATLLVSERDTKRYLLFDDKLDLRGWTNIDTSEVKMRADAAGMVAESAAYAEGSGVNTPASAVAHSFDKYAFSGIHLFSPRLFTYFHRYPDKFGIMDFYLGLPACAGVKGYVKKDLKLMDVGKIDTLKDAEDFVSENL